MVPKKTFPLPVSKRSPNPFVADFSGRISLGNRLKMLDFLQPLPVGTRSHRSRSMLALLCVLSNSVATSRLTSV